MICDPHKSSKCNNDLSIIQIGMIYYVCCCLYRTEKWMKSSEIGCFVCSTFGLLCIFQLWMICMIHFWMVLSMLVNNSKSDVVYFWMIHSMRKSVSESRCLNVDLLKCRHYCKRIIKHKRIHYRCKVCRLSPNFLSMFLRARNFEFLNAHVCKLTLYLFEGPSFPARLLGN